MITKLPESDVAVLGFEVSGKITKAEEEKWIEELDAAIRRQTPIHVLVHFRYYARWIIRAGIEDVNWLIHHMKDIGKLAFVSDKACWRWFVALDRPFAKLVGIEERHFEPDEIEDAWAWLKED